MPTHFWNAIAALNVAWFSRPSAWALSRKPSATSRFSSSSRLAFGGPALRGLRDRRLAFRLGEHRRGHGLAQVDARIELLTDVAIHAHLHGVDAGHLRQRQHELREPRRQAVGARARGELRTEVDRGDTVLHGQALDRHASRQLRTDALLRFRGGRAGEQLLDRGLDAVAAAARDDRLLTLQEGDVDAHDPPILPAGPALTSAPASSPCRGGLSVLPSSGGAVVNAPRRRCRRAEQPGALLDYARLHALPNSEAEGLATEDEGRRVREYSRLGRRGNPSCALGWRLSARQTRCAGTARLWRTDWRTRRQLPAKS